MSYNDKVILITGGTGSFGSTAVQQFLKRGAAEVRVFSRDEKKQEELRFAVNDVRLRTFLGDVRDRDTLIPAIKNVDHIFHAAALKQVPSCEFFPLEALKTNVMGTENVLSVAIEQEVKSIVVLSTDKAVYPINAMGMSKAMMEKVAIAKARLSDRGSTRINVTRYGNVMASRGSVIPLFVRQILNNEPVTITSANMTRFLMSLSDSFDLVDHAFNVGHNGELFVQKAPASTIDTLFKALCILLEKEADHKVIGYRHGEKMYETLVSSEEMFHAKLEQDYISVSLDGRDLNYDKYISSGEEIVNLPEPFHSHNAERLDVDGVVELLSRKGILEKLVK